jgi:glycine/D-amino acid oxidase-like deaminating enzyme
MSSRRPWRAVATEPDWTAPTGIREVGRIAACTEGGLTRWVDAQRAAGRSVRTWEVLALSEITPGREPAPVA